MIIDAVNLSLSSLENSDEWELSSIYINNFQAVEVDFLHYFSWYCFFLIFTGYYHISSLSFFIAHVLILFHFFFVYSSYNYYHCLEGKYKKNIVLFVFWPFQYFLLGKRRFSVNELHFIIFYGSVSKKIFSVLGTFWLRNINPLSLNLSLCLFKLLHRPWI